MRPFAYLQRLALALLIGCTSAVPARAQTAPAQRMWPPLGYIATFFAYSSALIAVLAVVLAVEAVVGLQEAGFADLRPIASMSGVDPLGLTPTAPSVLGQLVLLAVIFFGFWYNWPAEQRSPTSASASAGGGAR